MYVVKGDITRLKVDIIVNSANKTLLGGGGLDGQIHLNAGPKLLEECKTLGGCHTGEAKMTKAYNLPADRVIHTVGPEYINGYYDEKRLLKNCYINSMKLAEEYRKENDLNLVLIAFPSISTGVFKYPKYEACKIAVDTIKEINNPNIIVIFVCHGDMNYKYYLNEVNGIMLI
ncbi:MAG: macro domain-containing protein [Methanobrevibacter sp.]|jgi:O-acetyl-ADP-ribose deacetylase (regulator of RNase III)|nr:macro domain-containing protein [Candidatus Methanoflexus mossambicus]